MMRRRLPTPVRKWPDRAPVGAHHLCRGGASHRGGTVRRDCRTCDKKKRKKKNGNDQLPRLPPLRTATGEHHPAAKSGYRTSTGKDGTLPAAETTSSNRSSVPHGTFSRLKASAAGETSSLGPQTGSGSRSVVTDGEDDDKTNLTNGRQQQQQQQQTTLTTKSSPLCVCRGGGVDGRNCPSMRTNRVGRGLSLNRSQCGGCSTKYDTPSLKSSGLRAIPRLTLHGGFETRRRRQNPACRGCQVGWPVRARRRGCNGK